MVDAFFMVLWNNVWVDIFRLDVLALDGGVPWMRLITAYL
jgi:hypothetical protein